VEKLVRGNNLERGRGRLALALTHLLCKLHLLLELAHFLTSFLERFAKVDNRFGYEKWT
jgi:hypothetical protein